MRGHDRLNFIDTTVIKSHERRRIYWTMVLVSTLVSFGLKRGLSLLGIGEGVKKIPSYLLESTNCRTNSAIESAFVSRAKWPASSTWIPALGTSLR